MNGGELFNMALGAAIYTMLFAAGIALLLGVGHKDKSDDD